MGFELQTVTGTGSEAQSQPEKRAPGGPVADHDSAGQNRGHEPQADSVSLLGWRSGPANSQCEPGVSAAAAIITTTRSDSAGLDLLGAGPRELYQPYAGQWPTAGGC